MGSGRAFEGHLRRDGRGCLVLKKPFNPQGPFWEDQVKYLLWRIIDQEVYI